MLPSPRCQGTATAGPRPRGVTCGARGEGEVREGSCSLCPRWREAGQGLRQGRPSLAGAPLWLSNGRWRWVRGALQARCCCKEARRFPVPDGVSERESRAEQDGRPLLPVPGGQGGRRESWGWRWQKDSLGNATGNGGSRRMGGKPLTQAARSGQPQARPARPSPKSLGWGLGALELAWDREHHGGSAHPHSSRHGTASWAGSSPAGRAKAGGCRGTAGGRGQAGQSWSAQLPRGWQGWAGELGTARPSRCPSRGAQAWGSRGCSQPAQD